MKRYEHGVIEVAETLHGNHIGTRCDHFGPGGFEALRDWLRWRISDGWEPSRRREDEPYDIAVRNLAFAALMLVSP